MPSEERKSPRKKLINPDKWLARMTFSYKIAWSDQDESFVGTCYQFPELVFLSNTPKTALEGIERMVKDITDKWEDIIPEFGRSIEAEREEILKAIRTNSDRAISFNVVTAGLERGGCPIPDPRNALINVRYMLRTFVSDDYLGVEMRECREAIDKQIAEITNVLEGYADAR